MSFETGSAKPYAGARVVAARIEKAAKRARRPRRKKPTTADYWRGRFEALKFNVSKSPATWIPSRNFPSLHPPSVARGR
jgi:hypothetical protein